MVLIIAIILFILLHLIESELRKRNQPPTSVTERCPRCDIEVSSDHLICPECRTLLRRHCRGCGRSRSVRHRFCPWCGLSSEQEGHHA